MKCYDILTLLVALSLQPFGSCYVTSGLPGHKHLAWLKRMTIEVCDTAPGELTQEMCSKTPQLLSAWAQNPYVPYHKSKTGADVYPHHGKECAIFCERLLKRLVDERRAGNQNAIASTQTYNALIDVWSRSGERAAAAQRAEEILIGMQDAYSSGQEDVQPDVESFRLVLKAWSQAKGEEYAPQRAQRLLEWMVQLSESGENNLVQPDADCFDIVLNAWASSTHEDAPQRTENLIMYMDLLRSSGNEKAKPTTTHFNHVLNAWSRSKLSVAAAQRAEDILNHMILLSERKHNEHLLPDLASYTATIAAWARSGDDDCGRRSERILKQAEFQYQAKNDANDGPDTIMYNLVIDAHAKTSAHRAPQRARAVLERQIRHYQNGNKKCRPDVYSFTSVLSACASLTGSASTDEKRRAFEIASSTFSEMYRFHLVPNHVSYGTMLKACGRLLPIGKERTKFTREYFRKACSDGCVGEMVLNRLEEAASPAQFRGLMNGMTKSTLPPEWTSRVPENELYVRKKNRSGKLNTNKQQ
jgi:hypothetical protein